MISAEYDSKTKQTHVELSGWSSHLIKEYESIVRGMLEILIDEREQHDDEVLEALYNNIAAAYAHFRTKKGLNDRWTE